LARENVVLDAEACRRENEGKARSHCIADPMIWPRRRRNRPSLSSMHPSTVMHDAASIWWRDFFCNVSVCMYVRSIEKTKTKTRHGSLLVRPPIHGPPAPQLLQACDHMAIKVLPTAQVLSFLFMQGNGSLAAVWCRSPNKRGGAMHPKSFQVLPAPKSSLPSRAARKSFQPSFH
jgi:hypothetical protein